VKRLALGAFLALAAWIVVFVSWASAEDYLSGLVGRGSGSIEGIVAWSVGGLAYAVCLALVVSAALYRSLWPLIAALGWGGVSEWLLASYLLKMRDFAAPDYVANYGPVVSIGPQAFEQRVDLVVLIHVVGAIACTAAVYLLVKKFDPKRQMDADRPAS
jgi:hypothetical protein